MIKEITIPKPGDIKKSRTKFALFPKKVKLNDRRVWIWLEKYIDYYIFIRPYRCDLDDYWGYSHTEIINRKDD